MDRRRHRQTRDSGMGGYITTVLGYGNYKVTGQVHRRQSTPTLFSIWNNKRERERKHETKRKKPFFYLKFFQGWCGCDYLKIHTHSFFDGQKPSDKLFFFVSPLNYFSLFLSKYIISRFSFLLFLFRVCVFCLSFSFSVAQWINPDSTPFLSPLVSSYYLNQITASLFFFFFYWFFGRLVRGQNEMESEKWIRSLPPSKASTKQMINIDNGDKTRLFIEYENRSK